jgi:hypothetical protein
MDSAMKARPRRDPMKEIQREVDHLLADLRHTHGSERTRMVAVWEHMLDNLNLCAAIVEAES